jgi:glycosyltransferase involved in cell wall biosynthesis
MVDLARSLRVPLVVSAHGADLLPDAGPNRGTGLLRQLQNAAAVVVPSQSFLGSVVDAFPWLRDKLRCIRNGYDEAELSVTRAIPGPSSRSAVTALCIAALIPKKGIDVLLRGLSECTSSHLKLRLIGEGPLRQELESASVALGLSDRVSFLGPKDRADVLDELARCDLLVMPSRHPSESFGLAVLEAMACAKPVIASAVGGLSELVSDRETGLLVRPEDPTALARALELMVNDPAMRASLGAAGRSKAKRLTVQATGEAYEALFTQLIHRHDGVSPQGRLTDSRGPS